MKKIVEWMASRQSRRGFLAMCGKASLALGLAMAGASRFALTAQAACCAGTTCTACPGLPAAGCTSVASGCPGIPGCFQTGVTTCCETLPRRSRPSAERPNEPTTTKSARHSSAFRMISAAGVPGGPSARTSQCGNCVRICRLASSASSSASFSESVSCDRARSIADDTLRDVATCAIISLADDGEVDRPPATETTSAFVSRGNPARRKSLSAA